MVLEPSRNYRMKVKVPLSQQRTEPGTPVTSTLGQGGRWQLIGSFHKCGAWKDSQNIDINHWIKLGQILIQILASMELKYLLDLKLDSNFHVFEPYPY